MYQNVQEALCSSDPLRPIHSYKVIRGMVERLTGITQIQMDMCINSCIAYTGPFESLEACPTCNCATSQYDDTVTTSLLPEQLLLSGSSIERHHVTYITLFLITFLAFRVSCSSFSSISRCCAQWSVAPLLNELITFPRQSTYVVRSAQCPLVQLSPDKTPLARHQQAQSGT